MSADLNGEGLLSHVHYPCPKDLDKVKDLEEEGVKNFHLKWSTFEIIAW